MGKKTKKIPVKDVDDIEELDPVRLNICNIKQGFEFRRL